MSTSQLRLLAIGFWLVAIACAIPFAAMYSEYADLRDGAHVEGTVSRVAPYSKKHVVVTIDYEHAGRAEHTIAYLPVSTDVAVGSHIELRASRRAVIRASLLDDKRPSPLFVVGAVAAFLLGLYTWLAPRRAARRRAARKDPLDVVIDGVIRTRNLGFGLAAFLVAAAGFFAIIPIFDRSSGTGVVVFIEILAATTVITAILLFARAYRDRDPQRSPIVELLTQHPEDIAWFYRQDTRAKGQLIQDAVLRTVDRKMHHIRLVPEDVDALMAEIARRAPHAARGHDPAIERAYKANPAQWRPGASS